MPDIFGEIFKDIMKGEDGTHTIERDDGYIRETTGRQYIAEVDDWLEAERLAIDCAKGPVLDVGCGAGRVGTFLQLKDIEYHGIDLSPGAIKVCKNRGLENVSLMSVENLEFDDDSFKTVTLFGNNLGILGHPDRVTGMLKDLHRITAEDGIILAATRDPIATDEPAHLAYHEKNRSKGFPPGLVRIRMHYKTKTTEYWNLLMIGQKTLEDIAREAGWTIGKIFGPKNYYVALLEKVE